MNKIKVIKGTPYALIDGVVRKNIDNMSFYYLDSLLLLQTEFDLMSMEHKIIVKETYLTFEEKEILERLLVRLKLQLPEEKKFVLYGSEGWLLE